MQNFVTKPPVVVILKPDSLSLAPDAAVIKAAQYGVLVEAQAAKQEASTQAARIVEAANAKLEQAQADGEALREQKRIEGQQQGRQEARAEVAETISKLNASMQAWIAEVEPTLIQLVTRCVKEVVETTDRSAVIQESVDRGLAELSSANEIKIKIAPSQAETIRPLLAEIADRHGLRATVRLEPDAMLKEGDCIVESPMGVVDLRIDTQLRLIKNALEA
jgi:type III secretion protein L